MNRMVVRFSTVFSERSMEKIVSALNKSGYCTQLLEERSSSEYFHPEVYGVEQASPGRAQRLPQSVLEVFAECLFSDACRQESAVKVVLPPLFGPGSSHELMWILRRNYGVQVWAEGETISGRVRFSFTAEGSVILKVTSPSCNPEMYEKIPGSVSDEDYDIMSREEKFAAVRLQLQQSGAYSRPLDYSLLHVTRGPQKYFVSKKKKKEKLASRLGL